MSLNLKPSHLMTVAACVFAGYALYESFKTPNGTASTQPGQAERDSGLTTFTNQYNGAFTDSFAAMSASQDPVANLLAGTQ